MIKTVATAASLALALSVTAHADETPNIEPGEWEYHNKMTFDSDMPIPDQDHSSTECVTLEDIEQGDAFLEDVEECEITRQDLRHDSMDYSMTCTNPDGSQMTMDASMEFHGDSVNGVIHGEMDSPMGEISMRIDMEGERIGDC